MTPVDAAAAKAESTRPGRAKTVWISEKAVWVTAVFVAVLVLWEASVKLFAIPSFLLPSLEDIFHEIAGAPWFYVHHVSFTLMTTTVGFGLAIVIGVAIAVGIVSSRILEHVFMALLALLHSLPKVALAPLLVIWLGTGATPKIVIAILTAVFTIVIDVVVGMQSIDHEMVNMARVKRASRWQILFKIRFPHALPNLFGALKAAASFALVGALVGEFVGGQRGLGYVILIAQGNFDTPRAFAALILLGMLGTALFYIVSFAETKLLPWHVSQRFSRANR
jgi:NitT/TauT family transport system permease protein